MKLDELFIEKVMKKVNNYLLRYELEKALRLLDRELKKHPQAWPLAMKKVIILFEEGEMEEAEQLLLTTREQYPELPVVYFWLARLALEQMQLEKALQYCQTLLELEPFDAVNYVLRAEVYELLERNQEAEEDYTKALELEEKTDLYYRRSYVRFLQKDFEGALADLEEARQAALTDGEKSRVEFDTGVVLAGMGHYDAAERAFNLALELYPDYFAAREQRAFCRLELEDWEGALEDSEWLLARRPDEDRFWWLKGLALYRLGRVEDALLAAENYLQQHPEDPAAYFNLGLMYEELGELKQATEFYSLALELDPGYADAYLRRAWSNYQQLELEKARTDLLWWVYTAFSDSDLTTMRARLAEAPGFDEEFLNSVSEQLEMGPPQDKSFLC